MNTVPIVVVPEVEQFLFKITGIPERNVIKILPPNCPNEALDEGMREWYIGHGLHLRDLTNLQIRLPAVELKQRVVIAAEIVRACYLAGYRLVKETAHGRVINATGMYADSNDSTGEVIHDNQGPVGFEN